MNGQRSNADRGISARGRHGIAALLGVMLLTLSAANVGATPPAAPGGYDSGLGCAAQCITYGKVTQDGAKLTARVKTTVPAFIQIQIAPYPFLAAPCPHFDVGAPAPIQKYNGAAMTDWTVEIGSAAGGGNIAPGATYYVVVIAIDNKGKTAYESGTFTAKKRTVVVNFDAIKVLDDADKHSKGEIEFVFGVNSDWIPALHMGKRDIKGGTTVQLPRNASMWSLENAPHYLLLRVQGVEYDYSVGYCSGGTLPYGETGGGETSCNDDWATATQYFDVDNLPVWSTALPQQHSAYFSFETTEYYLKFRVSGWIDVRWV